VPSLPIAHGVLEGTLGPGLGTLKRVANILRLFSRELPPIRPKLVTCAGMKGSSPSCQPLYVRRTRLLMPRGNPLSVGTGGGAAPRICRGRRPGPVSSGCHRVPGQSRRARCTARFNFLLSAARATVSFDTLSSERPAHIARCRHGSPQSGRLDGGRCVSLPHHAATAASPYRATAFNARTTKNRPPKDHPNICAA